MNYKVGQKRAVGTRAFFKKMWHYFKKNFTYLISLDFHYPIGDTILNGWPCFLCIFQRFCWRNLTIQPPSEAMVSIMTLMVMNQWLVSVVMHCASQHVIGPNLLSVECPDWSKNSHAIVLWCHDQDVNNQTCWCCQPFKGDLLCLWKKIWYQILM